mmetsp:Transcript_33904/g.112156  ORF Transcript_33904/g.112156 Transcript_33904/m.112156 type:complete len:263 (+) Transcript_33904:2101-2889(+)
MAGKTERGRRARLTAQLFAARAQSSGGGGAREALADVSLELLAGGEEVALLGRVGDDLVAVHKRDAHVEVDGRLCGGAIRRLCGGGVRGALLLEELVDRLLQRGHPRVAGEWLASQSLDEAQKWLRVAGPPVRVPQRGAHPRVVDDDSVARGEEGARLVHGHLCKHVPVVVAGGLVREQVRHRQQRPPARAALDARLHLVGERLDGGGAQLCVGELVQRLLEVGHLQGERVRGGSTSVPRSCSAPPSRRGHTASIARSEKTS